MGTGEVHIRDQMVERCEEIVDLVNMALGPKADFARTTEYWKWKHEWNPYGRSIVLLAVDSLNKLIGVRALLQWEFVDEQDNLIRACRPVDTVTHPHWQRRGVFKALTCRAMEVAAEQGVQWVFNTPNGNSLPGYLKLGWQNMGSLPVYVRLFRPVAMAYAYLRHALGCPATAMLGSAAGCTSPKVVDIVKDSRVEYLLAQVKRVVGWQTRRTIEWLDWRYARPPHVQYYAETCEGSGCIDGMMIYRLRTRLGMREAMIDECFVDHTRATDVLSVVRILIQQIARRSNAHYAVLMPGGDPELTRILGRLAFVCVRRFGPRLVMRGLSTRSLPCGEGGDRFQFTLGDIEGL